MKAYSYDDLGMFTGLVDCQWDNVTKAWLPPAKSTLKEPPAFIPNKVALFDGIDWTSEPDNRGVYYNTQTKEKIIISTPSFLDISNLTKLEPPERYYDWTGIAWELNLETEKLQKISEVKALSYSIIATSYPEWKQINLITDKEFALEYIATYKNKLKEEINKEITNKFINLSVDVLLNIRENFSLLNITDLISGIPLNIKVIIQKYYEQITVGIIAYTLIKNIRDWSDQKELDITNCNTIEELNNINLENYTRI